MITVKAMLMMMLSSRALPNISVAFSFSRSPRRMEVRAAAPAPTNVPKAVAKFITGSAIVMPANPNSPTA